MRILIVEDDRQLNNIIAKHLREAGYAVDCCFDGEDGLYYMESVEYDCVILDGMLPKKDGLSVLRAYRGHSRGAPVLMLTARDTVTARVSGLDAGADDYLIKPFAFDELLARVRAMLRRRGGAEAKRPLPGRSAHGYGRAHRDAGGQTHSADIEGVRSAGIPAEESGDYPNAQPDFRPRLEL